MKVHDEIETLTDVYLAGGLDPDERAAVEEHAASCAACGRTLQDAGAFHGWVKGLSAPGAPPADLEDRIIANLRAATNRRAPKFVRLLAGVAALFVLVVIGGLFTKSDASRTLVNSIVPGEEVAAGQKFVRHSPDVDGYAGDTSAESEELMSGWGYEAAGRLGGPTRKGAGKEGRLDDLERAPSLRAELKSVERSRRSATGFSGGAGGGVNKPASTPAPGYAADKMADAEEKNFELERGDAGKKLAKSEGGELDTPEPIPYIDDRKIIRNGEVHLEVESYQSAVDTITKVTRAQQGFVAGANSTKLANGKIRGTITLRIPPDKFEAALEALEKIGTVRHKNITSQDVTKHYQELSSRLKSKETLIERLKKVLLEGKGTVKELMEVEVQMSSAVEQMEVIKGEIKYYDNLVGLSTITLQVFEKDLGLPFEYVQTLQSNIGVTAEDVDAAYGQAQKIILDAKGQVVESRMNRAGEDNATGFVRAKVDAERFPEVREALKKLGQVDQDTVNQQQTGRGGQGDAKPGAPVKKEQAVIDFTVNLPPVVFTKQANLGVETARVEEAYQTARREIEAKGKITGGSMSDRTDGAKAWVRGQVDAKDFPALVEKLKGLGKVKRAAVEQVAEAGDAKKIREKGEVLIEITAPPALIPEESGIGKVLRETFTASIAGILWSFEKLVVGIALAGPWIVLALVVLLIWRHSRKARPA